MTQELVQVWRPGRNSGIEFGNIKQLEIHEPNTYKLMTWVEGFETNDFNYHYKIGKSRFGLWISRRLVSTENLQAVATAPQPASKEELTDAIKALTAAVQLLTVSINNTPLEVNKK